MPLYYIRKVQFHPQVSTNQNTVKYLNYVTTYSDPSTVLSNGVKVAESSNYQKCQKLTKKGLACSWHSHWMYFIIKWSVYYRKVCKSVPNTWIFFLILTIFAILVMKEVAFFSLFLLLGEICWVLSGKIGINVTKIT